MIKTTFTKESCFDVPADILFEWHTMDGALEKLIPPWESIEVVERNGDVPRDGSEVILRITLLGPITIDWETAHRNYEDGRQFEDVQVSGPFAHWVHTHIVEPLADNRSRLIDHVEYALPFGWPGYILGNWFVRYKLNSMFTYRHKVTGQEVSALAQERR